MGVAVGPPEGEGAVVMGGVTGTEGMGVAVGAPVGLGAGVGDGAGSSVGAGAWYSKAPMSEALP